MCILSYKIRRDILANVVLKLKIVLEFHRVPAAFSGLSFKSFVKILDKLSYLKKKKRISR